VPDPTRTHPKAMRLDVRILGDIENWLAIDTIDNPGKLLELWRRENAQGCWRAPADDSLEDEIDKALEDEWLHLDEIAPVLRLRGWNRLRYGHITVSVQDMFDMRRALGALSGALGGECDDQLDRLGEGEEDIRAAVEAQLAKDDTCGECLWCQVCRLHSEVSRAMWDAGVELGLEYRYDVLGQPLAQANWEVYGHLMPGFEPPEPVTVSTITAPSAAMGGTDCPTGA
jgi:hypothetical protein